MTYKRCSTADHIDFAIIIAWLGSFGLIRTTEIVLLERKSNLQLPGQIDASELGLAIPDSSSLEAGEAVVGPMPYLSVTN